MTSSRSSLMPVNRRWPIAELLAAADEYVARTGRRVSYEYTLMAGVNDSDELADGAGRAAGWPLVPRQSDSAQPDRGSGPARAVALLARCAFEAILRGAGIAATIRVNRGRDILAACGQLRLAGEATRAVDRA